MGEAGLTTRYLACCGKQKTNLLVYSDYTLRLFPFLVSFSATSTQVSVFTMMLVNLKDNVQLKSVLHFPSPKTTTAPATT